MIRAPLPRAPVSRSLRFMPVKNFGFKVGKIGAAGFEARVRELVDGYPTLRAMVIPVLVARAALREQL